MHVTNLVKTNAIIELIDVAKFMVVGVLIVNVKVLVMIIIVFLMIEAIVPRLIDY